MRIKIEVDSSFVFGNITPQYEKTLTKEGSLIKTMTFDLFFDAPRSTAEKINTFLDTLGQDHIHERHINLMDSRTVRSYTSYYGTSSYLTSFYEALGIHVPSLSASEEPEPSEIIDFIHPAIATAAGVSVDHEKITALFEACDVAEFSLFNVSEMASFPKVIIPFIVPDIDIEKKDFTLDLEELQSLTKHVYQQALINLADHLPCITIPASSIDSSSA